MIARRNIKGGRNFARDEYGAVTIEFVVTLPLFLAALAFAFEFGRLFVAHHTTVNNVRSAARFLSRSDLSGADLTTAEEIIRTGAPSGGDAPDYLEPANATVTIDDTYTTFTNATFNRNGKTFRIVTRVEFPLSIFGFVEAGGRVSIPFVVVEDMRYSGV